MNRPCVSTLIATLLTCLPGLALAGADTATSLQSEANDGPVKVTARINIGSVRVAEPIQLVLEVESPRGTRIELPAKADRLGDFEVRRSERTADIPSAHQPNM